MRLRTKSGQTFLCRITYGWSLLLPWKNKEEELSPLKCLKQSFPLETYELPLERGIQDES